MKNQNQQNSKISFFLMIGFVVTIICCPFQSFAQNARMIAEPDDVWELSYTVSIKGSGAVEPDPGGDGLTIFWGIDRYYSGVVPLTTKGRWQNASFSAADKKTNRGILLLPKSLDLKLDKHSKSPNSLWVKVKDYYETYLPKDCPCEGLMETRNRKNWDQQAEETVVVGDLSIEIDNKLKTFSVTIPFRPSSTNKNLTITEKRTIDRSSKECGQPAHEEKVEKPIKTNIGFPPEVKDLIVLGKIQRENDSLKITNDGGYFWSSDIFHPDEPLIEGIPDSKDKVEIKVSYSLKKTVK